MTVYISVNIGNRGNQKREGWVDVQGEGTADPKCIISLSLSLCLM